MCIPIRLPMLEQYDSWSRWFGISSPQAKSRVWVPWIRKIHLGALPLVHQSVPNPNWSEPIRLLDSQCYTERKIINCSEKPLSLTILNQLLAHPSNRESLVHNGYNANVVSQVNRIQLFSGLFSVFKVLLFFKKISKWLNLIGVWYHVSIVTQYSHYTQYPLSLFLYR